MIVLAHHDGFPTMASEMVDCRGQPVVATGDLKPVPQLCDRATECQHLGVRLRVRLETCGRIFPTTRCVSLMTGKQEV